MSGLPENLARLSEGEDFLRAKTEELFAQSNTLGLHLSIAAAAMDLLEAFSVVGGDGEDEKAIQLLGFRIFNAFASALRLAMSGYGQTSTLILRDVLETVFLIDRFRLDRPAIERWRMSKDWRDFSPRRVREYLDKRDGHTSKKRAEAYRLFSGLAGHPSMEGIAMLRPKGINAHLGPFLDPATIEAVISDLGTIAVQVGEVVLPFIPKNYQIVVASGVRFAKLKATWLARFYPNSLGG